MNTQAKRAAIYARVSTDDQEEANQVQELRRVAEARGWTVVQVYTDHGISGSKGRDQRPGLDAALKDASRRSYDVLMAWAVDRLGRSLEDLLGILKHCQATGTDLFIQQQAVDTTTPTGRLVFQVMGAFAEWERALIVARVNAGVARAKAAGTHCGRPATSAEVAAEITRKRNAGATVAASAAAAGVSLRTAQRVLRRAEMGR